MLRSKYLQVMWGRGRIVVQGPRKKFNSPTEVAPAYSNGALKTGFSGVDVVQGTFAVGGVGWNRDSRS